MLDLFLDYIVVPVVAFITYMFTAQNKLITKVEVLSSQIEANKVFHERELAANRLSHEREVNEIRQNTDKIYNKLDSIEAFLRRAP